MPNLVFKFSNNNFNFLSLITFDLIGIAKDVRAFNGSISSLKIWNTSLSQSQIIQEYQNTRHITEDNYKLNDFIELGIQTYNESASSLVYNSSFDFNVTINDSYESSLLEGLTTTYNFSITNISSISSSDVNLTYNNESLSLTESGLDYNASKSFGLVGNLNNSFTWNYSILGVDGEYYTSFLTRNQIIEDVDVGLCSAGTNTTTLYLSVIDENNFSAIADSKIEGVIEYWNEDNAALKVNYSFENVAGDSGYSITSEYANYSNSILTYNVEDVIDTNFNVKENSIISYIQGRRDLNTTPVELNIYKGVCGTGTLLANVTATDEVYISSMYKFKANLSISNYSDVLLPDEDYCLRYKLGYADIFYLTGQSYDSDIGFFSSQKIAGRGANISFQKVIENPTEICLTPSTAELNYHAYFKSTSGQSSITNKYYVYNETLDNNPVSINLYNFNSSNNLTDLLVTSRNATDYSFLTGSYTLLQRFYTPSNIWRTTQMFKTGDYGAAIFNIYQKDQDYKLIFKDELFRNLKVTDSMTFTCDTVGECDLIFILNDYSVAIADTAFIASYDYDNATDILNISWSDTTGETNRVDIEIRKETMAGTTTICSSTSYSSNSDYQCNITGYSGEIFVSVEADTETELGEFTDVDTTELGDFLTNAEAAIWTVAILITIIGAGLFSPIGSIIFTVMGLILVAFLGIMTTYTVLFITIAAIIGLVLSFKMRE